MPLKFNSGKIEKGKTRIVFKDIIVAESAIVDDEDKNNNNKRNFQKNEVPMDASKKVTSFLVPKFENSKF